MPMPITTPAPSPPEVKPVKRSQVPFWGVVLVCTLPVVLAYMAYFHAWRPQRQSNYGTLIVPQQPVPSLQLQTLAGDPIKADVWRKHWTLIAVDQGECLEACARKLHVMRQVRLSLGEKAPRVARAWLVIDEAPVPTLVIRAYDGTQMWRARATELSAFLPLPAPVAGMPSASLDNYFWLVDPHGNLMMRFDASADPMQLRKDIVKLLFASRIG